MRKISKKQQVKRLVIVTLVLLVIAVGGYYVARRINCVSIAPTGQCYTQDIIDDDNGRGGNIVR